MKSVGIPGTSNTAESVVGSVFTDCRKKSCKLQIYFACNKVYWELKVVADMVC